MNSNIVAYFSKKTNRIILSITQDTIVLICMKIYTFKILTNNQAE